MAQPEPEPERAEEAEPDAFAVSVAGITGAETFAVRRGDTLHSLKLRVAAKQLREGAGALNGRYLVGFPRAYLRVARHQPARVPSRGLPQSSSTERQRRGKVLRSSGAEEEA